MRKLLITAIIGSSLFTSCNSADSAVETVSFDSSIIPPKKANTAPVTATPPTIIPQNTAQTVPVTSTPTPAPVTTVRGMNPPHGQPGHRCDIAVGAPLNSPPAKTTAVTTSTPVVTPQPVTKTAPGMNPPHGQPGHRCDIAVGAPLNSAPSKPATVTPTTPAKADAVNKAALDMAPVKADTAKQ